MYELISKIKSATKKRFLFREKLVYTAGKPNLPHEIDSLEGKYGFTFPAEIRQFLLELGAGSTEDLYISHAEEIYPFDEENGPVEGFVAFATDIFGNYLAFNPNSDMPSEIFYCSHDPLGYAMIASDIRTFLQLLIDSGFDNVSLTEKLDLIEHD